MALQLDTNKARSPFAHLEFDGIVGLGFPALAEGNGFSLLGELVKAGTLHKHQYLFGSALHQS